VDAARTIPRLVVPETGIRYASKLWHDASLSKFAHVIAGPKERRVILTTDYFLGPHISPEIRREVSWAISFPYELGPRYCCMSGDTAKFMREGTTRFVDYPRSRMEFRSSLLHESTTIVATASSKVQVKDRHLVRIIAALRFLHSHIKKERDPEKPETSFGSSEGLAIHCVTSLENDIQSSRNSLAESDISNVRRNHSDLFSYFGRPSTAITNQNTCN